MAAGLCGRDHLITFSSVLFRISGGQHIEYYWIVSKDKESLISLATYAGYIFLIVDGCVRHGSVVMWACLVDEHCWYNLFICVLLLIFRYFFFLFLPFLLFLPSTFIRSSYSSLHFAGFESDHVSFYQPLLFLFLIFFLFFFFFLLYIKFYPLLVDPLPNSVSYCSYPITQPTFRIYH